MSKTTSLSASQLSDSDARTSATAPVTDFIRPGDRLLSQLRSQSEESPYLLSKSFGNWESGGRMYELPRYLFLGPQGGGDVLRIGIFATLYGDEFEGALALSRLVAGLLRDPSQAQGYALFIYPLCNPTGYEDNTLLTREGRDINGEFWQGSTSPEVQLLEREIWTHAFHGIITLGSDAQSDGLSGAVNGTILSEALVGPALRAAEVYLPRGRRGPSDGSPIRNGIIYREVKGSLQAPPQLEQLPFEIALETPRRFPLHLQVEALDTALLAILSSYRQFISIAQNI